MKVKSFLPSGKKGQVQSIAPAILLLVFAGVVLVLGLVILQELRDSDISTQVNSETIVNESLTVSNGVTNVTQKGLRVSREGGICDFNGFTFLRAVPYNNSALEVSANFVSTPDGFINFSGPNTSHNNTILNVTYSYTFGDEACDSGNATIVGLATFADFWEIIVLSIVITIVIGLLLVVFAGRRTR